MNHEREDTRYQFKIKEDSPLWTSILGVFHKHGLVCVGKEFVAMMQIILGGTVAQLSHMDFCPRTSKWFPNRKAANAKEGAGPLMGWPFKGNPTQYHDALRSRHFPASTIIGLDVHGQHTPKDGSPCTFRLVVCAENFTVDRFDPSLCRVKPSAPLDTRRVNLMAMVPPF